MPDGVVHAPGDAVALGGDGEAPLGVLLGLEDSGPLDRLLVALPAAPSGLTDEGGERDDRPGRGEHHEPSDGVVELRGEKLLETQPVSGQEHLHASAGVDGAQQEPPPGRGEAGLGGLGGNQGDDGGKGRDLGEHGDMGDHRRAGDEDEGQWVAAPHHEHHDAHGHERCVDAGGHGAVESGNRLRALR